MIDDGLLFVLPRYVNAGVITYRAVVFFRMERKKYIKRTRDSLGWVWGPSLKEISFLKDEI